MMNSKEAVLGNADANHSSTVWKATVGTGGALHHII